MEIDAEHVQDVLLHAVGETSFVPQRTSVDALFRCLYPQQPQRQLTASEVTHEQRVAIEQQIHQLVFTLGCEAEASGKKIFDYSHPLSNRQPVLPRLFDLVLALGGGHYLEPGFIFTLIEMLVEMTMHPEECHTLIDWILLNKEALKQDHIFERGKLILLRTVNRMLKILQRGEDSAYHIGRLLFFMSEVYPMAERSATNHSGLRDQAHPIKTQQWNEPFHDDFGRAVDKSVYDLYWKTLDHVQRTVTIEIEAMRTLDHIQRLMDYFKSHPCRREGSSYLTRTPVTLVNDTSPEQFTDITRDPDCRMECMVQIYVFIQKLLAPSKNPVITTDGAKQRLVTTLSDVEHYIKGDHDLKQRWGPIHETLLQEPHWIDWKNEGATDWTLPPIESHPWQPQYCRETDEMELSEIHACLDGTVDQPMGITPVEENWDMKYSDGVHIEIDRDLEPPDFEELHVPTFKEFVGSVMETAEPTELESDTAFCWRTYRLLSEHAMPHMFNPEYRTNFAKLLGSVPALLKDDKPSA